jgi:hypothetical protein
LIKDKKKYHWLMLSRNEVLAQLARVYHSYVGYVLCKYRFRNQDNIVLKKITDLGQEAKIVFFRGISYDFDQKNDMFLNW